MCAVDLVDLATNGLEFTPSTDIELVLLVPQYHHRPWNVYAFFRAMRLYRYPADVAPLTAGEPPPSLLRVARTLADDSRPRILRHVAQEPKTFTELVKLTGLAKSTVHHHMVALRAAGLVRVHDVGEKVVTYSLRPDAEDHFGAELRAYLR
jgi:DNA-binding transcriptional ArsR family regulator